MIKLETQKFIENVKEIYAVDWLKIEIHCDHDSITLSDGMTTYIRKQGDSFDLDNISLSYKKTCLKGSYNSSIFIKSTKESSVLEIEGNFFKFLYGQNITGTTNITKLVSDLIEYLKDNDLVTPTAEQLKKIECGNFKITLIDLNKALVFETKEKAINYLNRIRTAGSYPNRKNKHVEDNGVYFNKESKRLVIKYYHKGTEIIANSKHQSAITDDLKALADLTVRFEIRLKWRDLNDKEKLYASSWSDEFIRNTVDTAHSKLRLPDEISLEHLPKAYRKFMICYEQGQVHEAYTDSTIKRYKSDLMKKYGISL